MRRWLCIPLILAILHTGAQAREHAPAPETLLASARAAMLDAERLAEEGDALGVESALRRALAAYDTLIDEHEVSSASLYAGAGSVATLLEEPGRAVLHYRRALRLDPAGVGAGERARRGLETARALVRTETTPAVGQRVERLVMAWRPFVPMGWVFWVMLAGYAGVCAAWCLRLLTRWRPPRWPFGVMAALAAAALVTDGATRARAEGVVQTGVVARTGPGEALYPPAFSEPLTPGVEFRALERRDGWIRASFGGAGEAWIPEGDAELI